MPLLSPACSSLHLQPLMPRAVSNHPRLACGSLADAPCAILRLLVVQGLPMHDFLGDVFEIIFDEHAVEQIRACAPVLREALDTCSGDRPALGTDKHLTQSKVLGGVVSLVNAPKGVSSRGEAMLKKTPAILMALCAPLHPLPARPSACPCARRAAPNPPRRYALGCSDPLTTLT